MRRLWRRFKSRIKFMLRPQRFSKPLGSYYFEFLFDGIRGSKFLNFPVKNKSLPKHNRFSNNLPILKSQMRFIQFLNFVSFLHHRIEYSGFGISDNRF